jgi:sec-independent protein translocase protein TatA
VTRMLGTTELLIILGIVLLLFGGAKLPKLARSLGEAQREFKRGNDDDVPPRTDPAAVPPQAVSPPPTDGPVDPR